MYLDVHSRITFNSQKIWKQPKCPSTNEWIKMWCVCVCVCVCVCMSEREMKYYSVIKKKEILPFAATWKDLENIMLSERSQTDK